jgi:hypothetical protein
MNDYEKQEQYDDTVTEYAASLDEHGGCFGCASTLSLGCLGFLVVLLCALL